jgi:hypothetical protein
MSVFSSFQLKNMLTAVAQEAAHLVSLNNSGVNSPNPSNNTNNTGSGLVNKNFGFSTNPFTQQVVFSGPGMRTMWQHVFSQYTSDAVQSTTAATVFSSTATTAAAAGSSPDS